MAKWNVSVDLQLSIDYDDIEADTREEAEQIAKDRALEDIDWNNCECDMGNPIVYCCYEEEPENSSFVIGEVGSDAEAAKIIANLDARRPDYQMTLAKKGCGMSFAEKIRIIRETIGKISETGEKADEKKN